MRRALLLFWLIVGILGWAEAPAWTADSASSATAAAPNADSPPLQMDVASQAGTQAGSKPGLSENCPDRPPAAQGAPSAIVVQLDPDTLWRPRGAEVRFTISGPGGPVGVAKVRVCFGWSSPDGAFRQSQALIGSPQVRSIANNTGSVEYGAAVPLLRPVPNSLWWPRRIIASTPYVFTGVFTVPVSDMVVEVTTTSGAVVVSATQVGITDVVVAWVVVAAVLGLVWLALDGVARVRGVRGRNLLLRVISTRDGYASLSQMQIVLWTVVVGLSAIYVMTLSGNLIAVSEGTLVLLGIASAAALAARLPGLAQTPAIAPVPAAVPTTPEWSDLVIPDRSTREIDVTRLQMLAFTLITAAFVLIKVVVDYEIPTIPANFLVLMGISNGVYVGGRRLPSQPKNGGAVADP